MESKQTAVEWLVDEIEKHYIINNGSLDPTVVMELKRQAIAMEKEQQIKFAEFVATYPDKNKNAGGEMLHAKSKYDGAERTIDLLKEYYKL